MTCSWPAVFHWALATLRKYLKFFHDLLKVNFINLQAVTYPTASMMVLRADSVAISIQILPEIHPTLS